jgi:hypothetical protein
MTRARTYGAYGASKPRDIFQRRRRPTAKDVIRGTSIAEVKFNV